MQIQSMHFKARAHTAIGNATLQANLQKFGSAGLAALRAKRAGQHIVITGRGALPELIALADLVTEMREIKHPFAAGIQAQRGIDF